MTQITAYFYNCQLCGTRVEYSALVPRCNCCARTVCPACSIGPDENKMCKECQLLLNEHERNTLLEKVNTTEVQSVRKYKPVLFIGAILSIILSFWAGIKFNSGWVAFGVPIVLIILLLSIYGVKRSKEETTISNAINEAITQYQQRTGERPNSKKMRMRGSDGKP